MYRSSHQLVAHGCRIAALAFCCALVAGCKNDPYLDTHIEMLNAERRALEDQLYDLEFDYERKVRELEEAQSELQALRGGSIEYRSPSRTTRPPATPSESNESLDLSPPMVSPGVPEEPRVEMPQESGEERQLPPPPIRPSSARFSPAVLQPDDPRITHLFLDPARTGGSDFDAQPGDDGIAVVLEPRNEADDFVPLSGPLSIVALDYARRDEGDAARVARWDLDAKQVNQALRNNGQERGIQLRLRWPQQPPQNSRLLLAVRFTTADGRQLEARRDIFVSPPGQLSQRWTPRSPRSPDGTATESVNVARQPSPTDGARMTPRTADSTHSVLATAGTSEVESESEAQGKVGSEAAIDDTPVLPVWRPTR